MVKEFRDERTYVYSRDGESHFNSFMTLKKINVLGIRDLNPLRDETEPYKPLSLIRGVLRGSLESLDSGLCLLVMGGQPAGRRKGIACLRKTQLEFVLRRWILREMRHILSV